MSTQRLVQRGVVAAVGAILLFGALMSVLQVHADSSSIRGEDFCASIGGVWSEDDSTCVVLDLRVRQATLTVSPTVTVAVYQSFHNGDLEPMFPMPSMWGTDFYPGTTEISGTLISYTNGNNYDTLRNFGVLWVEGEFVNQEGVSGFCSRLLPYPPSCSGPYLHRAYLSNLGRMLLFGHLLNEAVFENNGELVVADPAGGTIPMPPQQVDAASLFDMAVDETSAQLVNESEMQNDGVIQNLGTILVKSVDPDESDRTDSGFLVNRGHINNFAALAFAGETYLENRGTVSNTGVLILDGSTLNEGMIIGDGAIINRAELLNVGLLDGLIYNEGEIINAGTISGTLLGPGNLVELSEHAYLPITFMVE